ncbi:MAG TPA: allophanate hydrolase [Burkholderiales bacterium]|nr:allophanate hydrolase [Burkholderiales bacterium]
MLQANDPLDLAALKKAYAAGLRPSQLVAGILQRIARRGDDKVWIARVGDEALKARAAELERADPASLPLYGIPFAVKDNIDVAGLPTTAACPQFAYSPKDSASVVARLVAAGAIVLGKTNLDQFATGLVGVRSPYGVPGNSFNSEYIPGGSSSGSAVAVAAGLASFSLGTDTAGSGRVPAAFNNLVGLKPSRGVLSTRGVVPACRSLDCVSVFALTADDAAAVLRVARGYDGADPFSRREAAPPRAMPRSFAGARIGVPREDQLQFFGNAETPKLFRAALEKLGGEHVTIDLAPFLETARLLYEGPWVAERYVAIREFIERQPKALHPVTLQIIAAATKHSAIDAFSAYYRLKALQRRCAPVWDDIDVLVTPTAGTIYRIAELEADPLRLNANLGYYTNFMNLLDLAAIAVPAGFQRDGLPFGITLAAPAFADDALCALGDIAQRAAVKTMGATGLPLPAQKSAEQASDHTVRVAVCGAHMSGLPLNHQLVERGARLALKCRTAPVYRLYALTDFAPPRPGMLRADAGGAIEVEVWDVPAPAFGSFVAAIPPPLGIGTVTLEDGEQVKGFLCEARATQGARDITGLGSWRQFIKGGGSHEQSRTSGT